MASISGVGASVAPRPSLLPSASVHLHSILLSAVAGYVDAAGFASLVGLLPAHVTGELVSESIALFAPAARAHAHLWVLPVFLGAVVMATLVARLIRRQGQRPLAGLLLMLSVALALFSASDSLTGLLHATGSVPILITGGCAVAAMGFQNALMRESLKTSCPTTVMTGNVTQVVVDLTDRAFSKVLQPSPYDRRPRSRLGPVSAALAAFVCFAILGGWLTRVVGSSGALLPTVVVAILTVRARREDRVPAASSNLLASAGTPRVPSFDPPPVWPQSLLPQAPVDAASMTQIKSAQVLPPSTIEPPNAANRAGAEKRTISGTQLAQRFRDDK